MYWLVENPERKLWSDLVFEFTFRMMLQAAVYIFRKIAFWCILSQLFCNHSIESYSGFFFRISFNKIQEILLFPKSVWQTTAHGKSGLDQNFGFHFIDDLLGNKIHFSIFLHQIDRAGLLGRLFNQQFAM
jgi:hypothetical protein